jgi:SAM-dependent methyltransferase
MEAKKSYRSSHKGEAIAKAYSDIYSGFRKNGRIADRFSYARWLLEKKELSAYFNQDPIFLSEKRYLDFACGTGRLLSFLAKNFYASTGVDISKDMLNIAEDNCNESELICADITCEHLFDGRKFDIITAFRFFLRAETSLRQAVFARIYDLLDDDGVFIFNIHDNKNSLNWPLYLFSRIAGKESPIPGPFDLGARPHFQESEVRSVLEESGFQIVKTVYLGFVPNILYGLPMLSKLYYKIDELLYYRQWFKGMSIERIYYCRKDRKAAYPGS